MRSATRFIPVLLLCASATISAQEPRAPETATTLFEIENAARLEALAAAKKPVAERVAAEKCRQAPAELSALTGTAAASPPDPFAQRLHASYEDFFSALSFAINSVKEADDGQALVVRSTPLRSGPLLLATSVTATRPALYQPLSDALPIDVRASVVDELRKGMTDFDDVLYSVSLSPSGDCDAYSSGSCFGKSPSAYRGWLSQKLTELVEPGPLDPADDEAKQALEMERSRLLPGGRQPVDTRLADIAPGNQARILAITKEIGRISARGAGIPFDIETYSRLLDNQPQLAATAAYRSRGRLCGPDEFSATLEFQVGGTNVNSLRRWLQRKPLRDLMKDLSGNVPQSRFVLAASYKRRTAYRLASVAIQDEAAGSGAPSERIFPVGLDEPSSDEFSARAQWGTAFAVSSQAKRSPRFDVSGEAFVTHRDSVREKNRLLVTATLTVPLGEGAAIPVSVTWANKAEYLTNQHRQWGAHLGVSYRLPWGSKAAN